MHSTKSVDVVGTLCSPMKDWPTRSTHLVSWKMKITHQTSHCLQRGYFQRGLQCLMGMESKEEKKKREHQREGPVCVGSRPLAGSQTLWSNKRVVWQFRLLIIRQFIQALCLSWNEGWILFSIDFICHRQCHRSWKAHYFLVRNDILKDFVISLKKENQ